MRQLSETGKVSLGDWHLDAKMFPHLHPFGTGSLRSEDDGCSMSEYIKNRLLLLRHEFRRSPVWSFAMMDRLIKNDLYFRERGRKKKQAMQQPQPTALLPGKRRREDDAPEPSEAPEGGAARPQDNYAMLFGRVDPRHIPESASWWQARQTELMAIPDDHELGMMTGMVTVTLTGVAGACSQRALRRTDVARAGRIPPDTSSSE